MLLNKKTQGVDVCEKGLENVNGHDRGFPSFFYLKNGKYVQEEGCQWSSAKLKTLHFSQKYYSVLVFSQ